MNPEQRAAVAHVEGPLLVLAGAGSGKTRVITRRIAYLLATGAAKPGEILAVTFTNKAANEMRERVAELVGKETAKSITVSTFHSFCLGVLRQSIDLLGYRRDFSITGTGDVRSVVRRIVSDLNDSTREEFRPETLLEAIGAIKNAGGHAHGAVLTLPKTETRAKYETWMPEIYDRYQSALRAANALDFDDLLLKTLELWGKSPEALALMQNRYRFVMVDEFQDTNRVQYEIVRTLVQPHRNLCVVGDDDQSIYAWRGADPRNILELDRHFPDLTVVKLEQNYRSTKTVLAAANAVIKNNSSRRDKTLWTAHKQGRTIDWIVTANDEHEARMVVSWLRTIQAKSGARWRDFCILYRSNTQARPFELEFRKESIPYVVVGGQEFFERSEVRDVVSYLKVLANPRDETAMLRIINMPRRGIGDTSLHKVHELCHARKLPLGKGLHAAVEEGIITGEAAKGVRGFMGLMAQARAELKKPGAKVWQVALDVITAIDYAGEIERSSRNPEQSLMRWGNVEAVIEAIKRYEAEADKPSLRGFLDESSLNRDEDRRSKGERRQAAVTLMTMHSAKGLEFPFVFIVGCEEGLMPHEKSAREGNLEEERRLFYVAITRAMRHLTIFEARVRVRNGREKDTKPSPFLVEIPAELIRRKDLTTAASAEAALEG